MLVGCYSTPPDPKVITITKQVPVLPPAYLLNDCSVKQSDITTNRELLTFAVKSHNQNVLCSIDKAALRKWRAKHE
ncbi:MULTISPECIES: hypothetical protein [unclassified Pseudoalteromonas]